MNDETFREEPKSPFSSLQPKTSFWLGFGLAWVCVFIIGFFLLLGFFINQMQGKNPFAKSNAENTAVADNGKNIPPSAEPTTPPTPTKVQVASLTDKDHVRGNRNAKVSVVEFSDIQCPFCQRFHETMRQVVTEYGDNVNWVYRHFPLESIHPNARPAANAAECASEQGKFWEFADELFANQSQLGENFYNDTAKKLGLDTNKFSQCLKDSPYNDKISQQATEGQSAGGRGTPYTVIVVGDQTFPVSGAVPISQLKAIIDPLLGK